MDPITQGIVIMSAIIEPISNFQFLPSKTLQSESSKCQIFDTKNFPFIRFFHHKRKREFSFCSLLLKRKKRFFPKTFHASIFFPEWENCTNNSRISPGKILSVNMLDTRTLGIWFSKIYKSIFCSLQEKWKLNWGKWRKSQHLIDCQ